MPTNTNKNNETYMDIKKLRRKKANEKSITNEAQLLSNNRLMKN